ncbi:MAG: ribosome silencing factor [Janthinobacterium lividum]
MASAEVNQMLAVAAAACEDKKGEDIRILALDPTESGLTDFFLICTGTNDRQTVAITDEIEIRLKREFGNYPNAVEGRRQGEWILMDYVDFIVHVFLPEKRAYYGLERLRPSATTLSIADLNAEVRAAISSKRPRKAVKTETESTASEVPSTGKKTERKVAAKKSTGTAEADEEVGIAASRKPAKKSTKVTVSAAETSTEPVKKSAGKKSAGKKVAAKKSAPKKGTAKKAAAANRNS